MLVVFFGGTLFGYDLMKDFSFMAIFTLKTTLFSVFSRFHVDIGTTYFRECQQCHSKTRNQLSSARLLSTPNLRWVAAYLRCHWVRGG